MSKFRKKPVVIEAMRHEASVSSALEIEKWAGNANLDKSGCVVRRPGYLNVIDIFTVEGWVSASVGDWIVKDEEGEFRVYNPDIFAATYEPVEEEDRCHA